MNVMYNCIYLFTFATFYKKQKAHNQNHKIVKLFFCLTTVKWLWWSTKTAKLTKNNESFSVVPFVISQCILKFLEK